MRAARLHTCAVVALGVASFLVLGGCSHEWDAYMPPETHVGAMGGGSPGGGGAGGVEVPGTCPSSSDGTPLVKVVTPDHETTCVDATEVTRAQYQVWLTSMAGDAGAPTLPAFCSWDDDFEPFADWPPGGVGLSRPVAYVDWCDALAYCLAHDKRLCGAIGGGSTSPSDFQNPSASEWFNACTQQGKNAYPYGPSYEGPTCNGKDYGQGATVDVGTMPGCRPANPVFDLSGNVWEWVNSCASASGPTDACRIRGGGFNNAADNLICGADDSSTREATAVTVGFRCCADPLP